MAAGETTGQQRRRTVAKLADVTPGRFTPVALGRGRILLTQLSNGTVCAIASRCPHQGADLEAGCIVDLVTSQRPGTILTDPERPVVRCPWHGFEYDLATGCAVVAPPEHRNLKIRTFQVEINDDDVVIVD